MRGRTDGGRDTGAGYSVLGEIVSKCPLTNQGFDIAWRNLTETYDNPRMLVNDQLKSLFALPFLDKETSSGLKSLQLMKFERAVGIRLLFLCVFSVYRLKPSVCGNRV